MKRFINDYWWLIAIAAFLWLRMRNGKQPPGAPSADGGGTVGITDPKKPESDSVFPASAEANKTTATAKETATGQSLFPGTGTRPSTHVCNAGTGTDVYQEAAKEMAKYDTCPTHGKTMRHIHEYCAGHVNDYYRCTVCGLVKTVYTK